MVRHVSQLINNAQKTLIDLIPGVKGSYQRRSRTSPYNEPLAGSLKSPFQRRFQRTIRAPAPASLISSVVYVLQLPAESLTLNYSGFDNVGAGTGEKKSGAPRREKGAWQKRERSRKRSRERTSRTATTTHGENFRFLRRRIFPCPLRSRPHPRAPRCPPWVFFL